MLESRLRIAAVALMLGAAHLPASAADRAFAWPAGARAAVSLAYDDALDSQLDHAIPSLDRHGLKATFYLTLASDTIARRLDEWRKAARAGHELGNHSLFHQCSGAGPGREWVPDHRNLDTTSAAGMRDQVLLANSLLHAIDGARERTFTPPCGDLMAKGENYVEALKPAFVAVRTPGAAVVGEMSTLDPFSVGAGAYADVTGQQLIAIVEQAAAHGTMAHLTFHGVGADYLAVSRKAHDELLKYLAEHRHIFWTDTFISIMKYVRTHPASEAAR
jgi:peptidoglycan/xylan/chitin deacetylase (PgdA/CDA1 family)